jgi:hypothetical protein
VLEIGAGEGDLGLGMITRKLNWDCLDLLPRPHHWPRSSGWIKADVLSESWSFDQSVIVANLVLHHFTAAQLRLLGRRLRGRARVIVVSDLVRSRFREKIFSCVAHFISAHPVSRHDGRLSIRAGFRGNELPEMLGLDPAQWKVRLSRSFSGAYRLLAVKRA